MSPSELLTKEKSKKTNRKFGRLYLGSGWNDFNQTCPTYCENHTFFLLVNISMHGVTCWLSWLHNTLLCVLMCRLCVCVCVRACCVVSMHLCVYLLYPHMCVCMCGCVCAWVHACVYICVCVLGPVLQIQDHQLTG